MGLIAGASQFLSAATLANTQGAPAQSTTLLDNFGSDLLAAGRRINNSGIGISSSARALNQQILNNPDYNQLLSLTVGSSATIEGLQQEILALRAGLSDDQLAPSLRGQEVDTEA
ncbi:MAG: hypothetical protein AAF182_01305 [Pseudomonadota bacterium]